MLPSPTFSVTRMKQPTSLRIVSVVLATVFLVASQDAAFAQAPTLTPNATTTIPSPNVASTAASAQTPKPAKKGLSLRISATTLELAVQALLESREKEGNLP